MVPPVLCVLRFPLQFMFVFVERKRNWKTPPSPFPLYEHFEKPPPPLGCNMSCGLSKKTRQTKVEKMCVKVCLIGLVVPVTRVVAMTFFFVNPNFIDIICTSHDGDP